MAAVATGLCDESTRCGRMQKVVQETWGSVLNLSGFNERQQAN